MQFAQSDSKMYTNQKNIPQGRPIALKSCLKLTYHLLIAASLDTFCLVAPQRYELAKKFNYGDYGLSNEPSTKVLRCPYLPQNEIKY